jgi:penicillin-binding protein 1A
VLGGTHDSHSGEYRRTARGNEGVHGVSHDHHAAKGRQQRHRRRRLLQRYEHPGKTGTTNDNFDRYFVGYTPYYVAAVWVGYKENERISYSVNPAASLWKQVMQQVHADLENKSFTKPSTGLTTVTICADSGLLCTDACHADPRGDRAGQVVVATGTEPTEECTLHKMVDICTEGNCLAGEFCPEASVVQKGYLDYVREDYGESIKADDDAYLISSLEKAFEESGGCSVHTTAVVDPSDPGDLLDPNDPDAPFIDNDPNNPANQTQETRRYRGERN